LNLWGGAEILVPFEGILCYGAALTIVVVVVVNNTKFVGTTLTLCFSLA